MSKSEFSQKGRVGQVIVKYLVYLSCLMAVGVTVLRALNMLGLGDSLQLLLLVATLLFLADISVVFWAREAAVRGMVIKLSERPVAYSLRVAASIILIALVLLLLFVVVPCGFLICG